MVVVGFVATIVAVALEPGRSVAWATALPLLFAGLGSGFTISPNQAISLSEVPTSGGGSAAGVLQTGQRVGSALGIAVVGAVFFAALAGSDGDWASAFRRGLSVTTVFVVAALVLAGLDVLAGRRAEAAATLAQGRPSPGHRWNHAH
jgi:MFS family permease